jgi:hypothetical protein
VELTDLATQSSIDRSTVFKHSSEQNVRRRHPALDAKQQVETVSGKYLVSFREVCARGGCPSAASLAAFSNDKVRQPSRPKRPTKPGSGISISGIDRMRVHCQGYGRIGVPKASRNRSRVHTLADHLGCAQMAEIVETERPRLGSRWFGGERFGLHRLAQSVKCPCEAVRCPRGEPVGGSGPHEGVR